MLRSTPGLGRWNTVLQGPRLLPLCVWLMNLFARIAVGALLLVSGAAKLKSFSRKGLGRRALAVAVPLAEVPTGIALILGWYLPIAIVAALFLFGIFTAAVTAALLRGRSGIPCG